MRFSILQRYILSEMIRTFVFTFMVLTTTFFLVLSIQVVHKYSKYLSFIEIVLLAPYTIGMSASFTIPLSLLAATTLVYGRMAYEKEILILRSAGIHFQRMFQPVFLLALVLCAICLYINSTIVPLTLLKQKKIKYEALEKLLSVKFAEEETTIDKIPNLRIYYSKLKNRKFYDLLIQRIEEEQVVEEVLAATGSVVYNTSNKILTFRLQNGSITHIPRKQSQYGDTAMQEERFFFEYLSFPISLEDKRHFNRDRSKYKNMWELYRDTQKYYVQKLFWKNRVAIATTDKMRDEAKGKYAYMIDRYISHAMEKHEHIAISIVSLLVVIIGGPLGILIQHNNRLVAFGISALPVLLIYYPLQMWGRTLGDNGVLPPFWACWLSNIVAFFIGVMLLTYIYRK